MKKMKKVLLLIITIMFIYMPSVEAAGEYTCKYTGQKTGASLTIEKIGINWKVTFSYNGNDFSKAIDGDNVGANKLPTKNCDDVFYIYGSAIDTIYGQVADNIRAVNASDVYANNYVAQYCNKYEKVEQFCSGKCKIEKPLCGSNGEGDSSTELAKCPKELRLMILFIKKVAFNTLQIFVPIILILMGTIDMVRAVISSDDKAIKDSTSKFIKRIFAALLFFFTTTIVSVVIGMFANTDVGPQDDWKACWIDVE